MPTPRRRNPVAYLRRIKRLIQAAVLPKQAIHPTTVTYATIARLLIPFGQMVALNMGKFFWGVHIDEAPTFRNRFSYPVADINGRKFTKSKKSRIERNRG